MSDVVEAYHTFEAYVAILSIVICVPLVIARLIYLKVQDVRMKKEAGDEQRPD